MATESSHNTVKKPTPMVMLEQNSTNREPSQSAIMTKAAADVTEVAGPVAVLAVAPTGEDAAEWLYSLFVFAQSVPRALRKRGLNKSGNVTLWRASWANGHK